MLAEKAGAIFTKLTDVRCGLMSGGNGNLILLTGKASAPLTDDEIEIIKNFLKTESGIPDIELQIDIPDVTPREPGGNKQPGEKEID